MGKQLPSLTVGCGFAFFFVVCVSVRALTATFVCFLHPEPSLNAFPISKIDVIFFFLFLVV
jgi:hypothetical protein